MARLTNRPGTGTLVALALGAGLAWLGIVRAAEPAWTPVAPMGQPRAVMTATPLPDGRVLVIGGFDTEAVQVQMDAELYVPAANSWTLTGPTTGPRFFATSQLLPDGRVLVAGGYDNVEFNSVESAEVFDPIAASWTAVAPLHVRRVYAASVTLPHRRRRALRSADQ